MVSKRFVRDVYLYVGIGEKEPRVKQPKLYHFGTLWGPWQLYY